MTRGVFAADLKRTSVLRRVPRIEAIRPRRRPGREGDVCAFQLAHDAAPLVLEAPSGRGMTVVPGDVFLATPGHRESTRWVVGGIPKAGLAPGRDYWVIAESGVVGALIGDSPREKGHLGQVKYMGAVCDERGEPLNLRQFATTRPSGEADQGAAVFLVLGTSSEVGKTTAAVAVLRALRRRGSANLIALKATGTSALSELALYQDFGASRVFDCVDFGLPTTYPSDRKDAGRVFGAALDVCLSLPADAVVVECGGDLFGANVPVFLACLKRRRPRVKLILAAPDALAALGAKRVLRDIGLPIDLITGPCTDTPTLQERTRALCKIPAINLTERGSHDLPI
jgi:hypothetical protein